VDEAASQEKTDKEMSRKQSVRNLLAAREEFCGIGTKLAKLRLNKIAKTNPVAKALRLALEIEDCSTLGKKYAGEWSYEYYERKHKLIHELVEIFKEFGWTFGVHKSNTFGTSFIIYFEIPTCEQISFHTNLDVEVPEYPKEWDGKTNSTLAKLEAAIYQMLNPEEQRSFL
jgi:hypothetical protein